MSLALGKETAMQAEPLLTDAISADQRKLRLLILKLRWMGLDAEAEQMSRLLMKLISAGYAEWHGVQSGDNFALVKDTKKNK